MKKYLFVLFLMAFIIPSVSLAEWWNPATWVNKKTQDANITTETKTYSSIKGGYSVVYPSSWPIVLKSDSVNSSNFKIKNSSSAVLPGSNSQLRNMDSVVSIFVSFGKLANGIDYSNYPTISEIIKDPKFGQADAESRLKKVSDMKIGGKDLKVMKLGNSTGISYAFVYKNKAYQISLMSGSQDQYKKDIKVFNDMVSSFKFNDSSTSSNNKNDVTKPPVSTKSDCLPTTAPWIKVLSPNGGETYTAGQKITVRWASCNIPSWTEASGSGVISIFISNLSGTGIPNWMLGEGTQDDGNELITLPTALQGGGSLPYGKNFKISVNQNDPTALYSVAGDISDNPFTINMEKIISQKESEDLVKKTWGDCSQGDCYRVSVIVSQGNIVTATYVELDDSVSSTKKEAVAAYQNNAWILGQPKITRSCHRGHADGAQGFSSSPCI